jgi:hypothetical protein
VTVKRLFGRESADYVVMVSMVFFLVIFGLVMVLSSSFVGSALGNDGNFFATFFPPGGLGAPGDSDDARGVSFPRTKSQEDCTHNFS